MCRLHMLVVPGLYPAVTTLSAATPCCSRLPLQLPTLPDREPVWKTVADVIRPFWQQLPCFYVMATLICQRQINDISNGSSQGPILLPEGPLPDTWGRHVISSRTAAMMPKATWEVGLVVVISLHWNLFSSCRAVSRSCNFCSGAALLFAAKQGS